MTLISKRKNIQANQINFKAILDNEIEADKFMIQYNLYSKTTPNF